MRLLILGGTIFLGRYLVETALERGHEVTLFNRGKHHPDLFPEVEKLRGDRDGGLEALHSRTWDAVIDTCGYVPRVVRASAAALAGAVGHYTFISSISVYSDFSRPGIDEEGPMGTLEDAAMEEVTGESYGPLKRLCEQAAEAEMPGRVLNIRPGLIVGPHDPSDRFTYWPVRVQRGGEMLTPVRPDYAIQVIDVRDLADWNIRMAEAGATGIYNAISPPSMFTLGETLEACRAASGSDAAFTWVSQEFLAEHAVQGWMELPLWVPEDGEHAGFNAVSVDRAMAAGLTIRPIADTVKATLQWADARPADYALRAGMQPAREAELLAAWHAGRAETGG